MLDLHRLHPLPRVLLALRVLVVLLVLLLVLASLRPSAPRPTSAMPRRSTGPRTPAGKQRSSRNATSHGIYCRDLVLAGESEQEFDAFRDATRLTRIEQRLERSVHRSLNELRKLRKLNDEVASLAPPLRPCPFLAEAPRAEDEVAQEVGEAAAPATSSVQNEANANQGHAAGAISNRDESIPTPPSTEAPLAGCQCHGEARAVGNPCCGEAPQTGSAGASGDTIAARVESNDHQPRGHDHAR